MEALKLSPGIIFGMNAIAIIPLAGLLSFATESVAARLGDTLGALLNVSFGNAVGGTQRLGVIDINSADDVTAAAVTAAAFNQDGGTGTTTLNGAVNTNTAAGVTITNETIAVNDTITTTNNGVVTLTATVAGVNTFRPAVWA